MAQDIKSRLDAPSLPSLPSIPSLPGRRRPLRHEVRTLSFAEPAFGSGLGGAGKRKSRFIQDAVNVHHSIAARSGPVAAAADGPHGLCGSGGGAGGGGGGDEKLSVQKRIKTLAALDHNILQSSKCMVCRCVAVNLMYFSQRCTQHLVCERCIRTMIDVQVLGVHDEVAQVGGQLVKLLPEQIGLCKKANGIVVCPGCRQGGLDLIGARLKILTRVSYAATKSAAESVLSRPIPAATTATAAASAGAIAPAEKEAESQVVGGAEGDLVQELRGALDDGCPSCRMKPVEHEGLPGNDLLLRNHIFVCPKRRFKCPYADCPEDFTWFPVFEKMAPVQHPNHYLLERPWWPVVNAAFQLHLRTTCQHRHACKHTSCVGAPALRMPLAILHSEQFAVVSTQMRKSLGSFALACEELSHVIDKLIISQVNRRTALAAANDSKTDSIINTANTADAKSVDSGSASDVDFENAVSAVITPISENAASIIGSLLTVIRNHPTLSKMTTAAVGSVGAAGATVAAGRSPPASPARPAGSSTAPTTAAFSVSTSIRRCILRSPTRINPSISLTTPHPTPHPHATANLPPPPHSSRESNQSVESTHSGYSTPPLSPVRPVVTAHAAPAASSAASWL